MKKLLIFVLIILAVILVVLLFKKSSPQVTENVINSVTFNCVDRKNIKAIFYSEKVALTLSDGRAITLPQNISASGARYTNTDETFEFWNKGDAAVINEDGKATFEDCTTTPDKAN